MSERSATPHNLTPHSDVLERSVLGSIMIDPPVMRMYGEQLSTEHFYVPANRVIFEAIQAIVNNQQVPDLPVIQERLRLTNRLEDAGGTERLMSLADTSTAAYFESYVTSLEELRYLRSVQSFTRRLEEAVRESNYDGINDLLSAPPTSGSSSEELKSTRSANINLLAELELVMRGEATTARPTNLMALNARLTGGGLRPGQLIVVAARPGMGKSVAAINFAQAIALNTAPVLFCALEMTAEEFQERLLASMLGDNPRNLIQRRGQSALKDIERNMASTEVNIIYNDSSTQTVERIWQDALRIKAQYGEIGAVVIDYLQLISGPKHLESDHVRKISHISQKLKQMARALKCPVIVLSQLSRSVEKRVDRRPILSDLRDCVSGSTTVQLASGEIITAQILAERCEAAQRNGESYEPEILSFDLETQRPRVARAQAWSVGLKPTVKIETAAGAITVSHEHLMWCERAGSGTWRAAGELRPGDTLLRLTADPSKDHGEMMPMPDPVINLINGPAEPLYDLSVPDTSCWWGSSLLTHNSGAIEQDADIVMFIYRDHYYNKDSDPHDTEFILAKQRGGPIDTVHVKFNASASVFTDKI